MALPPRECLADPLRRMATSQQYIHIYRVRSCFSVPHFKNKDFASVSHSPRDSSACLCFADSLILSEGWFLLVYVEDGDAGVSTSASHTHCFGFISPYFTCMWPPTLQVFTLCLHKKRPHTQPVPSLPSCYWYSILLLRCLPTPVSSFLSLTQLFLPQLSQIAVIQAMSLPDSSWKIVFFFHFVPTPPAFFYCEHSLESRLQFSLCLHLLRFHSFQQLHILHLPRKLRPSSLVLTLVLQPHHSSLLANSTCLCCSHLKSTRLSTQAPYSLQLCFPLKFIYSPSFPFPLIQA